MSTTYRIEEMQEKHLDQVVKIEWDCFTLPWPRQAFLNELYQHEFAHYYVALVGDLVAGYAGMWVILDEGHVTTVAVRSEYRGQKLGKALLVELELRAITYGVERLTLEVRPSNTQAQGLYRRLGFMPAGVRKRYYADNREDAIIMWKDLLVPHAR